MDVLIPNHAEFNIRHPALRLGTATETVFTNLGLELADQCAFWSSDHRILILPQGLDPLWFQDVHDVLGLTPPPVVSLGRRTGLPLRDLLHDGHALAELRHRLAGHDQVRLLAWGATPELYLLQAMVSGWGHEAELDCTPQDHYWASLYLDGKLSCVDLAQRVPGLRVPNGVTVTCHEELRGALETLLARRGQAIVKSPLGVGGAGSAVIRSDRRGLAGFWTTAHREPFFNSFPLVVQEYVERAPDMGCPAADLFIDGKGIGQVVLSCMTVDGHRFRNVVVGARSIAAGYAEQTCELGQAVGAVAYELGFRGWFCVDFMVGADGEFYLTEINARRSGAAQAIALLELLGADDDLVAHSDDKLTLQLPGATSYGDLRSFFHGLWAGGVRAYPTTVRGLAGSRPHMGIVTLGSGGDEARAIAAEIQVKAPEHVLRR
ncbi:hypothetical protein [Nonomuraea insulae]|uniref:ATP-grasp domain-containing protein n=1 Tax=Nonomuraea insulae TaxID=1616787 RepID=A0ABW1D863_9ACTN